MNVPNIIYQIWLGPEPSHIIKEAMQSVKNMNPHYEYILLGNEMISKYNLERYVDVIPYAFLSDYIRMKEVTNAWYVDADMIAKQSIDNLKTKEFVDSEFKICCVEYVEKYGPYTIRLHNGFYGAENYNFLIY